MAKGKSNGKDEARGTAVAVADTNGAMVPFDPSKFRAGAANMKKAAAGHAEFLRMDKSGDWFYGTNDTPVTEDDRFYIDPMGSVHGWQCWADTDLSGVQPALLGTVKAAHYDPMPERPAEVPATGREWAEMYGISAVLNGKPIIYTTTSLGGKDALSTLYGQMLGQFEEDPSRMVPVVQVRSDWYKHKKYGKTFFPVFNVVDWVEKPPAFDEPAETPAPARKAAAKKAPAKQAPAKPSRRA